MKKIIYSIAILVSIVSCNTPKNEENKEVIKPADTATAENTKVATTTEVCYLMALNKDTTTVSIIIDGNNVKGKMHWNPWQKDGALGTLKGTKNGDTLSVLYDYIIEGSSQKEEKIFVLQGDKLTELQAPLELKDDVMVVKNKATLKVKNILNKVNCN